MEEAAPTPEARVHYYPNDPYYDSLLQAVALQQMGYPVRLHDLPVWQVPGYPSSEEFEAYEERNFESWTEVTIEGPFTRYVESIEDSVYLFEAADPDLNEYIMHHPIKVVNEIDYGQLGTLFLYLDTLDTPHPMLRHRDAAFPLRETVIRSIVACGERRMAEQATGLPDPYGMNAEDLNRHGRRFRALQQQGFTPINAEQLLGIVVDFYRLIEDNFPDFRAFKRLAT